MKPDTQERPDFEKAAEEYIESQHHLSAPTRYEVSLFKAGANHGYNLLDAEILAIRNQFVSMLPTGDTKAWDWVVFSKSFLKWYDNYTSKLLNHEHTR